MPGIGACGGFHRKRAGNHEMKDQEELALRLDDHALAEALHAGNGAPDDRIERRVGRTEEERARQPDALNAPADDPRLQRVKIERDVRQLRHLVRSKEASGFRPQASAGTSMAVFALLAGLIVLIHLAFVVFAAAGALLALRWPWMPWVHVPAAVWAAYIEFSGGICPLTPLENDLRARAGLDYYGGDFVARHLFPVLYPDGLTREAQIVIGAVVLAVNLAVYAWLWRRHRVAAA